MGYITENNFFIEENDFKIDKEKKFKYFDE